MKYLFSLWAGCSWFTRVSTITFRSTVTVHTIWSALSLITSFSVSSGITDWSINTCQSDISLLSRCSTITTSTCDKRRKMVAGINARNEKSVGNKAIKAEPKLHKILYAIIYRVCLGYCGIHFNITLIIRAFLLLND